MHFVYRIPDYSQPQGAIATFMAAMSRGDVEAAIADMRLDAPHVNGFRETVSRLGVEWFQRRHSGSWRTKLRNDHCCIIQLDGVLPDGAKCIDEFRLALIDGEWTLDWPPRTEIWKQHPILGSVHFNGFFWETLRWVPAIDQVAMAHFEGTEFEVSTDSISAVELICAHQQLEIDAICQAVFELYQSRIFNLIGVTDDDGNDVTHSVAPPVKEPSELWNMLWAPFEISYARVDPDTGRHRFTLHTECQWDVEHGLAIKFENWKVVGFD